MCVCVCVSVSVAVSAERDSNEASKIDEFYIFFSRPHVSVDLGILLSAYAVVLVWYVNNMFNYYISSSVSV